jgi:glycosyltransferase involved in cell wall biosynthesis
MIKNLVSVIIPVYNAERYLRRCLDSVIRQTYSKLEIILINDGSVDSSGDICDEFAQKDSRFKVIHQKNGGVSRARNAGLNAVMGEFFTFIDADDTIDLSYIQLMVTEMRKKEVDLVRLSWYRGEKKCSYGVSFDKNGCYFVTEKNIDDLLWFANIWGLFRSESLDSTRFDEQLKYAEDNLFVLEYFLKSKQKKMILVNKPLYYYTIVNASASNISVIERLKLSEQFVERVLNIKCDVNLLPLVHKYAYQDYLAVYYYLLDNKLNVKDCFYLKDVQKKIIAMRKEGCREKNLSMSIVSFIYRHHLSFFIHLYRSLRIY